MSDPSPDPTTDHTELAPEREIALDLVRRGVMVGPLMVAVCAAFWGWSGVASSSLALVLVLVNFLIASALITWSVRISHEAMMAAVLGGYLIRLALLTAVVLPIRHADWFAIAPFAITLVVTHLGLLVWEMRYISSTLAYPGLAPRNGNSLSTFAKGPSPR